MDIRKTAFLIFNIFIFLNCQLIAQDVPEPVALSGVVVDEADLTPIPNVTIKNSTQKSTALADSTGFFSLTAKPGDTLIFEAMLYSEEAYIVPESFSGGRFAVIEAMHKDKLLLEEVTVRSFPSQEQFERAFLSADPGNLTDKSVALNVHIDEVREDPTNMQQYILDYNNRYATYRITREAPANNFLNPARWAEFIRNWQEGRFSESAVNKLEGYPNQDDEELNEGEMAPVSVFPGEE